MHRGICYASWEQNDYSSNASDRSLENITKIGADHISIVVTQYQDTAHSTEIKRTPKTPTDESLAHAINKAHKMGLKVMLKPHLDLLNTEHGNMCRSDIGFQTEKNWKKWFDSYRSFILHYANMAEKLNVEIFCIGTELSFTVQKDVLWRTIINDIREVYAGKLVYAANWDVYKEITFWDQLDYIGIDAYFPLYPRKNPSVTQIKRGWEKWKAELWQWHKQIHKPILFTEIGYTCSDFSAYEPWKHSLDENSNIKMQTKCYTAFFETIWGCSWLAGVYWWHWGIDENKKNNTAFSPQRKPASKIIKRYYAD